MKIERGKSVKMNASILLNTSTKTKLIQMNLSIVLTRSITHQYQRKTVMVVGEHTSMRCQRTIETADSYVQTYAAYDTGRIDVMSAAWLTEKSKTEEN